MTDRRMFRYAVPLGGPWTFDLTGDPVHVAARDILAEVEFWAEYTEGAPQVKRAFQVFGTGQPLPDDARWVGTCARTAGGLVWHLYEIGAAA